MSDEETVVEQEKVVSEETATEDAQENEFDLDKVLSEFETKSETKETTDKEDDGLAAKVKALESRYAQEEFEKVVNNVKGDLDVDTDFVEGWLEVRARKDQALMNAYLNRNSKPAEWAKVERALNKELKKRFPAKVDEEATEIHDAVTSAVRGASTKAPSTDDDVPDDIASWSQARFEAWVKEQGRKHG